MTAVDDALPTGSILAPGYRIVQHLRRGRDVDVYEVWSDVRAGRCVAKRVRPDRQHEARPRKRVLREGRLLRRLMHLHLARAYEVLTDPPTVILEILTGKTLERRLEDEGRLPIDEVVSLGLQLCSVLHYLHQQSLLHLDLKPSNIVCERGLIKLLDLSIARAPGWTRRGLGTRGYMAPEQTGSARVSTATDVWGLGAVLFEAATGRRASAGSSDSELARPASVKRYRRGLPAHLAWAIDGALQLAPEDRPALRDIMASLES